ncbi:MAG: biopolymer transporter ExbD [Firmicutes bacterium]|nr:biopolymer transporter ExbD [Bacillota bacterium]
MRIERIRYRKPLVQIIPLIDVMFFLLIFFMVFTTFRTSTTGLNVDLPRAATGMVQSGQEYAVTIDRDGNMFWRGRRVDAAGLAQLAQADLKGHPEAVVIIRADQRVQYRYLVQAIDAVRGAGGYRLALAVEQMNR